MYKLLIDSDALIKISKAEFLDLVANNFDVITTEQVFEETVKEGKEGFYQDAYKIEKLIQEDKIDVLKTKFYIKSKKPSKNFGKGEVSLYQAYKKGVLIVTDDLSFTSYLQKERLKCISSAHLLPVLIKKHKLKIDKAYHCLERLKPYIRKEVYELVKGDIKGE